MQDMGRLIEEMTREGVLISTAGLRPTAEGVRVRLRGGRLATIDGRVRSAPVGRTGVRRPGVGVTFHP